MKKHTHKQNKANKQTDKRSKTKTKQEVVGEH
jgi:hypothetical protein